MVIPLHQLTAAFYLAAGVAAGLGLALPAPRLARLAVGVLVAGVVAHAIAFSALHAVDPTPPLTDLPVAMSFMACVGTLSFLLMLLRMRLSGLVVVIAPMSFLAVFFAALRMPLSGDASLAASGSWPHLHVLLASAGLSLLGLAGVAGLFFLAEHRRLKARRPLSLRLPLPTLEGLDRVNAASLAVGFPLLTLGVVSGMLWVQSASGQVWSGTAHEWWSALAWVVYAVLSGLRFLSNQGARQAAASAVGGFAFLLFAVVGVGLLE